MTADLCTCGHLDTSHASCTGQCQPGWFGTPRGCPCTAFTPDTGREDKTMTVELSDAEILRIVVEGRGMCPFIEDVRDGSMCMCGLPALGHDETVIRLAKEHDSALLTMVERIIADRFAPIMRLLDDPVYAQAINLTHGTTHTDATQLILADELRTAIGVS